MGNLKKALVVCTQNACRSQMAEGFLKNKAKGRLEVFSAGVEPSEVNPKAIEVMQEIGIDISDQRSKGMQEVLGRHNFAYVIFVCEKAEQTCPRIYPTIGGELISWPFDDPASFKGSEEEVLNKFRAVRDKIGDRIDQWLKEID